MWVKSASIKEATKGADVRYRVGSVGWREDVLSCSSGVRVWAVGGVWAFSARAASSEVHGVGEGGCNSPTTCSVVIVTSTGFRSGLCRCPGIVWEPVRERAHTQVVRERSVTFVSAR